MIHLNMGHTPWHTFLHLRCIFNTPRRVWHLQVNRPAKVQVTKSIMILPKTGLQWTRWRAHGSSTARPRGRPCLQCISGPSRADVSMLSKMSEVRILCAAEECPRIISDLKESLSFCTQFAWSARGQLAEMQHRYEPWRNGVFFRRCSFEEKIRWMRRLWSSAVQSWWKTWSMDRSMRCHASRLCSYDVVLWVHVLKADVWINLDMKFFMKVLPLPHHVTCILMNWCTGFATRTEMFVTMVFQLNMLTC